MKKNEQLYEKPNHEHYMACRTRKLQIERFSKKVFVCMLIESVVLLFMFIFGLWLSALSWIPSLCGKPFTIANIAVHSVEIILLPVFAIIGCGKYKICDLILFGINCLIVIGCFFGGLKTVNTFPFLVGIIGVIITYPSISAYFDYQQLMNIEGFPQFNNLLANAEDNAEYKSYYFERAKNKVDEDEEMPVPTETIKQEVSTSQYAYMDDILQINDSENNF